jgi:hypothetical protein
MEELLGTRWDVFLGVTVLLAGFAAFMTGQAIARTWRPLWQVIAYGLLLAVVARFFTYALFVGGLLDPLGYLASAIVIVGIGLFAFRITRVQMMVRQYPWLYERTGIFTYRER